MNIEEALMKVANRNGFTNPKYKNGCVTWVDQNDVKLSYDCDSYRLTMEWGNYGVCEMLNRHMHCRFSGDEGLIEFVSELLRTTGVRLRNFAIENEFGNMFNYS